MGWNNNLTRRHNHSTHPPSCRGIPIQRTLLVLLLTVAMMPFLYLSFWDHFHFHDDPAGDPLGTSMGFHWAFTGERTFLEHELPQQSGSTFFFHRTQHDSVRRTNHIRNPLLQSSMPNFFLDRKLLLLGARLTISLVPSHSDVHVDVFGFPGDFFDAKTAYSENIPRCIGELATDVNGTLWKFDSVATDVQLFCQLNMTSGSDSTVLNPLKKIPMMLVPLHSNDGNQAKNSLIWRCNVTEYVNKTMLIQEAKDMVQKNVQSYMSVNFYIHNKTEPSNMILITSQDISMETGVGGKGGPTIRGGSSSYFLQPQVHAGLCVPTLKEKALLYLEEFVLHHLNVGFGSIVIGLRLDDERENPSLLQTALKILKPYIDAGVVSISLYGTPSQMTCDEDIDKMQFFQTCLYHHKGLTKYSATWDIDEFWIPPKSLQVFQEETTNILPDLHNIHVKNEKKNNDNQDQLDVNTLRSINKNGVNTTIIHASNWSTFSAFTQEDLIWQKSPYSQSISIIDVINAVEHQYKKEGCKESKFCFFWFPSNEIFLRFDWSQNKIISERTNFIGQDFELRWRAFAEHAWRKAVAHTKYAYMSGFHGFGSCMFEESEFKMNLTNISLSSYTNIFHQYKDMYVPFAPEEECWPKLYDPEVYGLMHHFASLFYDFQRFDPDNKLIQQSINESWPIDEYVSIYSDTVRKQLNRRKGE